LGIKKLFTVPEGKKITEKAFARVLVSSICGILLTMACLAGTTWAWFAVSIRNSGNVIETAQVNVAVSISDSSGTVQPDDAGNYALAPGSYALKITLADETRAGKSINILISAIPQEAEAQPHYQCVQVTRDPGRAIVAAEGASGVTYSWKLSVTQNVNLSFTPMWLTPENLTAEPGPVALIAPEYAPAPTEPATDPVDPSEETGESEATDPIQPSTEATDPTETTGATEPTEPTESTEPAEPTESTEATGESTSAGESQS
jgi:hypothetical protein